MGCCSFEQKSPKNASKYLQGRKNVSLLPKQIAILQLIFKDLSDRIKQHKINLENFLLFFHKNGYWGERLFKEFDYDETKLISQQEFIFGIANIFKSSEAEKISLLFKFFSNNNKNNDGVYFEQFLIMLYNYPKEDLKEILNDRYFFQGALKKGIFYTDSTKKIKEHKVYKMDSTKKRLKGYEESERSVDSMYPSLLCKQIRRTIQEKCSPKEPTVLNFFDGEQIIHLSTTSIQTLVKLFAKSIFKEQKIDIKQGKLNFEQFRHWISTHKRLYQNYYDGFHNLIWQIDEKTIKPKYLSNTCEMKSQGKVIKHKQFINCNLFLHHSILVVCESVDLETPINVICLQGLTVKRIYQIAYGFGFSITHRDGFYKEHKIFLKNQATLNEWMMHLQFFNGESVQQKYLIGEKIGTGKFSVVYRCQSLQNNRQYALKEIPYYKLDQESKNLICHESSIMKVVSHPLLLQYKQCFQTKTHIYIITELVKGRDLFDYVKEYKRLNEYIAAKILLQLIVGIRFLHSFEIVHRDLKPENIMIVCDQQTKEISYIKIIDFGFSNYLSKLSEKKPQQLLTGTPNYIAPQILKEQGISFKIDNFAIGSILFFMLTGGLAFNDTSITGILLKTIKGEYRVSQKFGLSKEAIDLIDKLLKNNPKDRISLEDALVHPWFQILNKPNQALTIQFKVQQK